MLKLRNSFNNNINATKKEKNLGPKIFFFFSILQLYDKLFLGMFSIKVLFIDYFIFKRDRILWNTKNNFYK
jgi:hypothetical protein